MPKLENTWISEEESPQISHIKMKSNEPVTETLSSEQKERAKPAKFCVNCGEQVYFYSYNYFFIINIVYTLSKHIFKLYLLNI